MPMRRPLSGSFETNLPSQEKRLALPDGTQEAHCFDPTKWQVEQKRGQGHAFSVVRGLDG